MTIFGSCRCGTVRYEVAGPFIGAGHCHCSLCRKSHGAAFVTWALLKTDQFRWTAGEAELRRYTSSPGRERCFCGRCGSQLAVADRGRICEVALGTVDGDPGLRPSEHVFMGSRASWYEPDAVLPRHEEWPPGMTG
jgi:hypothetical protein